MDPILQVLLSWQFVLYGLAVSTVLYILRQSVEYLAEVAKWNLDSSKFWNDFFLPLAPIAIGVVGALLLKSFPYPGFTPDVHGVFARGDRIIFGLVTGSLSTLMYRVIKALLYQKMVGIAQNLNTPNITVNTVNVPIEQVHLPSRGQL